MGEGGGTRGGAGASGGAPARAPLVSVVLVGHGPAEAIGWVLAALLADPADDFEVIFVDPEPARPPARPEHARDLRVHRFGGTGLSASEARALGLAAARTAQRVVVEMGPRPGSGAADGPIDDALAAALLVRPARELVRVLRAVSIATATPAGGNEDDSGEVHP